MSTAAIGTVLILVINANLPTPGWIPAEGQCLQTSEYAELAEAINDQYGKCEGGFLIPDLRTKLPGTQKWMIKAKP